jgi:hypothetical protein
MLNGFAARLPAGNAGLYPLVFQRFPELVSVITTVGQQPLRLWQAAQQGRRTGVFADRLAVMKKLRGRPLLSSVPPFPTAGWSPCGVPSGTCAGRLEPMAHACSHRSSPSSEWLPRRPGHPSFGRRHPSSQVCLNLWRSACSTPPLPTIVECLQRAIFLRRIASAQAIAIEEDYAAQYPPVVDPRPAVALGKEVPQPRHLRLGQPEKFAHDPDPLRRLIQAASG